MQSFTAPDLTLLLHQPVRDLAWCCFSAPMMRALPDSDAAIFSVADKSLWPWLLALDEQPQPLLDHLAQLKSTRLGIYYEALWHFFFTQYPGWELLQHNLQIDRQGATLGALDFLCCRDGNYWHVETAVKFYLCGTLDGAEACKWHHWIGPEGKDRLDLKLGHLRAHQLPLHRTVDAVDALQRIYPGVSWNSALCLQGYLFSPAGQSSSPDFSHPQHGKGYWWRASDLGKALERITDLRWKILERHQWLAPARENNEQHLLTNQSLATAVHSTSVTHQRPLLVATMQPALARFGGYWRESSRLFVVADNWPG